MVLPTSESHNTFPIHYALVICTAARAMRTRWSVLRGMSVINRLFLWVPPHNVAGVSKVHKNHCVFMPFYAFYVILGACPFQW